MKAASLAFVAVGVLVSACGNATGALGADVARHKSEWQARAIASYDYEFRQTGFFINCTGEFVTVHVRSGVVQSATLVGSDQPATAPLSCWPTIDKLFDSAIAADQGGKLAQVKFDAVLGYPTRIDVSGPPDASGSYFATALEQKLQ